MTEHETFDDLLAALTLEESEPTYEALLRWQKQNPGYRESLADFFAIAYDEANGRLCVTYDRTNKQPDEAALHLDGRVRRGALTKSADWQPQVAIGNHAGADDLAVSKNGASGGSVRGIPGGGGR